MLTSESQVIMMDDKLEVFKKTNTANLYQIIERDCNFL